MFLKAGALSLALLLASRLLGLVRESAVAAAFGNSALADLAVLMLSLPDWLSAVLASGALAYVLVPAWTGHAPHAVRRSHKRVAGRLLVLGLALAMLLWLMREQVAAVLAPGLAPGLLATAGTALTWSAASIPLALLAALGAARLQQGRDFLGLYGANLVVNAVVIGAIVGAAFGGRDAVALLGAGLLFAMVARLVWQGLRERRLMGVTSTAMNESEPLLPRPSLWAWAALSAGLPLALPFAARSLASSGGEGALAVFNYAWKLVELPLLLAVQLVATLALPAVAAAMSNGLQGLQAPAAREPLRNAFGLAWALACACAAGLLVGADAVAALLFGWGRMTPEALAQVAAWARVGAWGLLPQALTAVGLTVLASQRHMAASAWLFALGLAGVLAAGRAGLHDGASLMWALNAGYALVAAGVMATVGRGVLACLPWPTLGLSLLALLGAALWSPAGGSRPLAAGLAAAVLAALLVLAAGCVGWAGWRRPR